MLNVGADDVPVRVADREPIAGAQHVADAGAVEESDCGAQQVADPGADSLTVGASERVAHGVAIWQAEREPERVAVEKPDDGNPLHQ